MKTAINIKKINILKDGFVQQLTKAHPCLAYITIFLAMPMCLIAVVSLAVCTVVLPASWLFGLI